MNVSIFDSVKMPQGLGKSPINQAVILIRYESNYPDSALYGLLLKFFSAKGHRTEEMPLLQIPRQIREHDKNLKYQELYRCIKEDSGIQYIFGIGSNVIKFTVFGKYESWKSWKSFFEPIINEIKEKNIIKSVDGISLRYYDVFENDYFSDFNTEIRLCKQLVKRQDISLNTSFDYAGIRINLNIGNRVFFNGSRKDNASLIDIDCISMVNLSAEEFYERYQGILEDAHGVNKKVFFSLVNDTLLRKLEPQW